MLAIWGLGFTEHPGTPEQALELIDFFENNPDPKYQVTLVGGVPTSWRILANDSLTDPGWANYYCGLSVISPWTVGRYSNDIEIDLYQDTMVQDMAAATACGAEYMPVVYPGTAFHNNSGDGSGTPFNVIPRRGGKLYWRQVFNAVSIGVPMIYNAMFDEVDEDTAMYKIAATAADQPVGVDLVSMDADGYALPNDWYLRLAGSASQMLRGEVPLVRDIPIESGLPPLPLPAGSYRIRIQITTSSDFAIVDLKSGGTLVNPEIVSLTAEATSVTANGNRFVIGQTIRRANSGGQIDLVIDVVLSAVQAGVPLHFELESGAIGHSTVHLFTYVQDSLVEVTTMKLGGTFKAFDVPAELFISPPE